MSYKLISSNYKCKKLVKFGQNYDMHNYRMTTFSLSINNNNIKKATYVSLYY